MSLTIPPSSQAVLAGQNLYRAKTPLIGNPVDRSLFSTGDLVSLISGSSAIAVGPDSTFFCYEIAYPDATSPNQIVTSTITPKNPLILPAGADLSQTYPGTKLEKEVFLRLLDPAIDSTQNGGITQLVDLLFYLGAPPAFVPSVRNPKRETIFLLHQGGGPQITIIPIYGRRRVSVRLARRIGGDVTLAVEGAVGIQNNGTAVFADFAATTELQAATVVAPWPAPHPNGLFIYDRAVHGSFDVLRLHIDSSDPHLPSSGASAYKDLFLDIQMED